RIGQYGWNGSVPYRLHRYKQGDDLQRLQLPESVQHLDRLCLYRHRQPGTAKYQDPDPDYYREGCPGDHQGRAWAPACGYQHNGIQMEWNGHVWKPTGKRRIF